MRDYAAKKLTPAQHKVMREGDMEQPYFGKHWDTFEDGTYACASCGTKLFSSNDKIDSRDGWPTFTRPINENDIEFKSGMTPDGSVQIRCKKCHGNLGAVVGVNKYRIYSVALDFEETPDIEIELPDDKNEEDTDEKKNGDDLATTLKNSAGWIGGALLGAILGASGAYLVCQNFCSPAAGAATTTPSLIATSTPVATSTSATPSTTTPRATSSVQATPASIQGRDVTSSSTPSALDSGSSTQ